MYLAAGILVINATFWIEAVAFLLMLAVLARFVYPRISAAAEARQQQITEQLRKAEESRRAAEERLGQAEARLNEARTQAAEVIEGAGRSAEQLRADLKARAEEDARRVTENARKDIEAERQKAMDSIRGEVADLVVSATEKVVGERLDVGSHHNLIDRAIAEVGARDGRN